MKQFLVKGFISLTVALILFLAFISCATDTDDDLYGFGMCACKTSGFDCFDGECNKKGGATTTASGKWVLNCLGKRLKAPATMIVYFDYKASASSCWNKPTFEILVSDVSVGGLSFNCNAEGSTSISIPLGAGVTKEDISFVLDSGDWGSSVLIYRISYTP